MIEKIDKAPLVGLTVREIAERITPFYEPEYRAKQIYNWIHYQNVDSFGEMTSLSKKFRDLLNDQFTIHTLKIEQRQLASDNTEKFLWRLQDNRLIESVLIPESRRNTICISSQVGCSLGCKFCATGKMGFLRNLTSGEIVEQVLQVKRLTTNKITNVVFMGMGEPFMNYNRVIKACQILGDPEGVAVAQKKITISTSGVVPKIYQYTDESHPYGLAISLHSPD